MPISRAQSMRTLNLICAVVGSAYFSRCPGGIGFHLRPARNTVRLGRTACATSSPIKVPARTRRIPPVECPGRAIHNLEESFDRADLRALIQMATGSGKTFTAVNVAYRLLKFANAKRILFLVDRGNLGEQTDKEFSNFEPPDNSRKFPTLYTVQRLKTNSINSAAKVVITTIQRLYSMLKGETEFDASNEEGSAFNSSARQASYRACSSHGREGRRHVRQASVWGHRPKDAHSSAPSSPAAPRLCRYRRH